MQPAYEQNPVHAVPAEPIPYSSTPVVYAEPLPPSQQPVYGNDNYEVRENMWGNAVVVIRRRPLWVRVVSALIGLVVFIVFFIIFARNA